MAVDQCTGLTVYFLSPLVDTTGNAFVETQRGVINQGKLHYYFIISLSNVAILVIWFPEKNIHYQFPTNPARTPTYRREFPFTIANYRDRPCSLSYHINLLRLPYYLKETEKRQTQYFLPTIASCVVAFLVQPLHCGFLPRETTFALCLALPPRFS